MIYESIYQLGDEVTIDRDTSIVAVVTGVWFRGGEPLIQCGWMSNGGSNEAWFTESRLHRAEKPQSDAGISPSRAWPRG